MTVPKPDPHSPKPSEITETATYPSQIHTDDGIKREDESGTPIEVPSSYTEFIKAYTPIYTSPVSAGGFPKLSGEKGESPPVSQPSTAKSPAFSFGNSLKSPATPTITLPPPSPCTVRSAKAPPGLRRLRIPQSLQPLSCKDSPRTATPCSATPYSASPYSASPYSASPYSATPWSAFPRSATSIRSSFSPTDWKLRYLEAPRSATSKSVSVRQVVTRTVTYKRTPLDPPPKGKRRKTQECRDA